MSWTTPRTWVAGEVLTAALANAHIRDNLNVLKTGVADDGSIFGPLQGYREKQQTVAISANNVAVNILNGNHVAVALNAAITSFTVTNFPASGLVLPVVFHFTGDGTIRAITWSINSKTAKFPGGTAPTMTGTNAKIDKVAIYTRDGDTTWEAQILGMNI